MVSLPQKLVPLVDRDAVTSAYAPGHAPTEARSRTLRDHRTLSNGVAVRPRSTNRLAGQRRYYSVLNVLAAVFDRRGRMAEAREVAHTAEVFEGWLVRNVRAEHLADLASGRSPDGTLATFAAATHAAFVRYVDAVGSAAGVSLAADDDMPRWMRDDTTVGHFWLVEAGPGPRVCHALGAAAPSAEPTADDAVTLSDALATARLPGTLDGLLLGLEHRRDAGDTVHAPEGVTW